MTNSNDMSRKIGLQVSERDDDKVPRWLRNRDIAKMLRVSQVTIWRWQRDPAMNFPAPSVINGVPFTSAEELDAWMKSRVVSRTRTKQVA